MMCEDCGAAVVDEVRHRDWHAFYDDLESRLATAEDHLDEARHRLFEDSQ